MPQVCTAKFLPRERSPRALPGATPRRYRPRTHAAPQRPNLRVANTHRRRRRSPARRPEPART
eukprot:10466923-Alexandrium_andersonii.AAC.1